MRTVDPVGHPGRVGEALEAVRPPPWRQVWADNFNGPSNSSVNIRYWRFDTDRGIFGTGEIETMTSSR